MRVEFVFFDHSPYLYTLRYSFIENPFIDLSIKALGGLDLMEIPLLKEWIENSLRSLVFNTLVLPQQVSIPYHRLFSVPEDASLIDEETRSRREEIQTHNLNVEKSKQEGDYVGLLYIRVIEARKLKTYIGGLKTFSFLKKKNNSLQKKTIDPYIIVSTDAEIFTTNPYVGKQKKTPSWGDLFEFLVKKKSKMELQINVMARDKNRGDSYIGSFTLDFSGFTQESKDFWLPLEGKDKKNAGEIRIGVRFVISGSSDE